MVNIPTPTKNWIQTYSGVHINPLDIKVEDIHIVDIAKSLSQICRFNGHCPRFYSVAQHSLEVARNCSPVNKLWGLLHDASESFISDIARPVKHSDEFKQYRKLENKIMKVIAKKFGLPSEMPQEVMDVDTKVLRTEAQSFGMITKEWDIYNIKPYNYTIQVHQSFDAECHFTNMFYQLTRK